MKLKEHKSALKKKGYRKGIKGSVFFILMTFKDKLNKLVQFLKEDSWSSFFVWIILIIIFIKLILFPGLSLVTGTNLPLVVVESCSMYHYASFNEWWNSKGSWYENRGINKTDFKDYSFRNGLNKGDIIFVISPKKAVVGDVIIFNAGTQYPIIHRIVFNDPISTKGDNNPSQLNVEGNINKDKLIGKALFKIPYLGWIKLIFFEPFRAKQDRGFCNNF